MFTRILNAECCYSEYHIFWLSIIFYSYAECYIAECHYDECCYVVCGGTFLGLMLQNFSCHGTYSQDAIFSITYESVK